jgi:hypothetical protein
MERIDRPEAPEPSGATGVRTPWGLQLTLFDFPPSHDRPTSPEEVNAKGGSQTTERALDTPAPNNERNLRAAL